MTGGRPSVRKTVRTRAVTLSRAAMASPREMCRPPRSSKTMMPLTTGVSTTAKSALT